MIFTNFFHFWFFIIFGCFAFILRTSSFFSIFPFLFLRINLISEVLAIVRNCALPQEHNLYSSLFLIFDFAYFWSFDYLAFFPLSWEHQWCFSLCSHFRFLDIIFISNIFVLSALLHYSRFHYLCFTCIFVFSFLHLLLISDLL